MEDYKTRMIAEYKYIKDKYDKVHNTIIKAEARTLPFELNTSIELLKEQANVMGRYLYILEVRSELEGIGVENL